MEYEAYYYFVLLSGFASESALYIYSFNFKVWMTFDVVALIKCKILFKKACMDIWIMPAEYILCYDYF